MGVITFLMGQGERSMQTMFWGWGSGCGHRRPRLDHQQTAQSEDSGENLRVFTIRSDAAADSR
jgi:hypothetical protein